MIMICSRSQQSSPLNFALDVTVELLIRDGFGIESANGMDDLPKLILIVAVFELVVNILEVGDVQLSLSLHVQKSEIGLSSLLAEWVSLNHSKHTIRAVNSFKKPSKSKALPPL